MLSRIEYKSNRNIETKVNFFCDFYKLTVKNLGKVRLWEYENPLSIIDKIIFQIENNPKNRVRYLDHHLNNSLLTQNGFNDQFEYLRKLRPLITEYLSTSNKNEWLNLKTKFLINLKKLRLELDSEMVKVAVQFITQYLKCNHPLEFHKEDFKYLIRIIVSDLKFNDKPDRETVNLVRKIMSRDPKVFPLPISILNKSEESNFSDITSEFISNRTFTQQFEGILNYKKHPDVIGYYLIRVFNLILPENKKISFKGIEILSPKNVRFNSLLFNENNEFNENHWKEFISNENISIAIVKGNLSNSTDGFRDAINKVQLVINFINNKLNLNSYLDIYDYRATVDFQKSNFSFSTKNSAIELSEGQLERLNDDNPYIITNSVSSQAKTKFLYSEQFYHRAITSNEVSDYWHYLECVIPMKKIQNGKYEKQVKSAFANILMINHKWYFPTHIVICIFNLLQSHTYDRTDYSFSYLEMQKLSSNWKNSTIIQKSRSFKKHSIIKDLHLIYSERNNENNLKKEYDYYYSLIHELYEIRNAYVHGGLKNSYAEKKMKLVIPPLITKIRNIILKEIIKGKTKSMEKIVERLIKKGEKIHN